jgi:4-diphosphocytidyl-2-C-methyl-D-erythritol kinase
MRVVAPAKINLALAVLGKREDGFHDLRTIFQAIDLCDDLVLYPRTEVGIDLRIEGPVGVEGGEGNLVVRAGALLAERHAPGRGARVVLGKRIPTGAGLGGGSSDAAATLLGLEKLWGLRLDPEERAALALELGSDVPFFLAGGTARGEGRGDELTPLPPPPIAACVLALPELALATRDVFEALRPGEGGSRAGVEGAEAALRAADFEALSARLVNDLEGPARRLAPPLEGYRRALEERGAPAVGFSGSGAAFFIPFRDEAGARRYLEAGPAPAGFRLLFARPVAFGARVAEPRGAGDGNPLDGSGGNG